MLLNRSNSNPDFQDDPDSDLPLVPDYTPIADIDSLNIKEELLFSYNTAKKLLVQSINDPLNQRAQTVNTVTKVLQSIIELQERLHNVETLKEIETALVETLRKHPSLCQTFLDAYQGSLIAAKDLAIPQQEQEQPQQQQETPESALLKALS